MLLFIEFGKFIFSIDLFCPEVKDVCDLKEKKRNRRKKTLTLLNSVDFGHSVLSRTRRRLIRRQFKKWVTNPTVLNKEYFNASRI
jgi:hypothetical protein